MKQRRYNLPGHYITIRLNNQPLAQWLLEQEIAIPPDTTGVRYACGPQLGAGDSRGLGKCRNWRAPNSEALFQLAEDKRTVGGGFAVGGRPAGLPRMVTGRSMWSCPTARACHQLV